jgi:hypothetical protein
LRSKSENAQIQGRIRSREECHAEGMNDQEHGKYQKRGRLPNPDTEIRVFNPCREMHERESTRCLTPSKASKRVISEKARMPGSCSIVPNMRLNPRRLLAVLQIAFHEFFRILPAPSGKRVIHISSLSRYRG